MAEVIILTILELTVGSPSVRATQVHYQLQLGCYFSSLYRTEWGSLSYCDVVDDFIWNHAYFINSRHHDPAATVDGVIRFYTSRRRQPCAYLSPTTSLRRIRRQLEAAGFSSADHECWMFLNRHCDSHISNGPDFHAHEVRTDPPLARFLQIVSSCFRPDYATAIEREFRQWQPHKEVRHFLLSDGVTMVSTGSVYRSGGYAIIHNVGTRPEFRRRGAASYLVRYLASVATTSGANVVYLQCESQMEHFYNRLGFETRIRRTGWVLPLENQ